MITDYEDQYNIISSIITKISLILFNCFILCYVRICLYNALCNCSFNCFSGLMSPVVLIKNTKIK